MELYNIKVIEILEPVSINIKVYSKFQNILHYFMFQTFKASYFREILY